MPEHRIDPASLVDTARYPLDDPQDDRYRNTLSLIRPQLERDGCAVIPGFLVPTDCLTYSMKQRNAGNSRTFLPTKKPTYISLRMTHHSPKITPGESFSNEPTASSRVTATMNLRPAIPSITGPH